MKQFPEENLPPEVQEIAERMNVDPGKIPPYQLPELPFSDSTAPAEFLNKVRPELIRLMERYMYGPIPPRCEELRFDLMSEGEAFDGLAVRREIDIVCRHRGRKCTLHMLLYIPKERKGKVPVFFGLNFKGNHACTFDEKVTYFPFERYPDRFLPRLRDSRFTIRERGAQDGRWEFEKVIRAGFASATICYHDISPDRFMGFDQSILSLFFTREQWLSKNRSFGELSAWAWGVSRGIDALETQEELDMTKLVVHGHSRLGKTALWAGANDPRIAITISNGAGSCGAKLCHHYFGENFEWIDLWNAHWLRADFRKYVAKDLEYPIDQHFLLAAIAPRMLYISDACEDVYADPEGEFLSMKAANRAWRIFGMQGLGDAGLPAVGQRVGNETAFFMNSGGHAVTEANWDDWIAYATEKLIAEKH